MWQADTRKGWFMDDAQTIFIGQGGGGPQKLLLGKANRHGLIAGLFRAR
jgi:hypothetical protein